MPKSNIPLCEMVFDNEVFSYEISYFGIVETIKGDEVAAYLSGILYGKDAPKHWDKPVENLAILLGNRLSIHYIPS
jgi:hypothetical protein